MNIKRRIRNFSSNSKKENKEEKPRICSCKHVSSFDQVKLIIFFVVVIAKYLTDKRFFSGLHPTFFSYSVISFSLFFSP